MEKRTFLAIALSLLVLYAWNAVTIKDKKPLSSSEKSLPTTQENKKGALEEKAATIGEETAPPSLSNIKLNFQEATETLVSDKIEAEFSNVGGNLNRVTIRSYDYPLPLSNVFGLENYNNKEFSVEKDGQNSIRYAYIDENGLKILKTYELTPDYLINATITIINLSKKTKDAVINIEDYVLDTSSLDIKKLARDQSLMEYSVHSEGGIYRKSGAFKFAQKESRSKQEPVIWAGYRDRYFCLIVKPIFETNKYFVDIVNDKRMKIVSTAPTVTLAPGQELSFKAKILAAPQDLALLKGFSEGFDKIMVFTRFGLVDGISKAIYHILFWIHKVIPNWGICIIIIAFVIYGITYPLTMRSMLSMKEMQKIQPQVAVLREKHKNNSQKLNQEIMALYKEHKVNPFGGCLPMLLQMPIFIGLYQVLWRSVFFKGANFLWIKDLSQPDRLIYPLPVDIPFLGNEFNILPILMGIVMYIQQKITSKNMVVSDSAQASQQKMMTTFFPIFLTVIFYKFASGLALYFTMFYALSCLTQIRISKITKAG